MQHTRKLPVPGGEQAAHIFDSSLYGPANAGRSYHFTYSKPFFMNQMLHLLHGAGRLRMALLAVTALLVLPFTSHAHHGQAPVSDIDYTGMGTFSGTYTHSTSDHVWIIFNANAGDTITMQVNTNVSTPAFEHYYWIYRSNTGCIGVGSAYNNGCLTLVQHGGGGQFSGTYTHIVSATGQYAFQLDSYHGNSGAYSVTISGSTATTALCTNTPQFTSCPNDIIANGINCQGAVVSYTASAPATNVAYSYIFTGATTGTGNGTGSGATFNMGVTHVMVLAKDVCGTGTDTCSFKVTVKDNTAPTITCPQNMTVANTTDSCGALVNYTMPTVFDDCSGSADPIINGSFEYDYAGWKVSSTSNVGTFGIMTNNQVLPFGGQLWDFGTNTKKTQVTPGLPITATSTDGNKVAVLLETGSASHQMYQDVTLPNGRVVLKFDLKYDNHAGAFDANSQFFSVVLKNPSTNAVLATLYKTGSSDPAVQPWTTKTFDISAYAGQTVRLTMMQATINNFFFDVMMDNIRIDSMTRLMQTAGLAPGQKFPIGTTTNTYTATDLSGNTSSCSFNITVTDTQKAKIITPANVTVKTDAASCEATSVNLGAPVVKDNCGVQSISNDAPSTFPQGITTVTWTATDIHGNTQTAAQTVTVRDSTAPSINCPQNMTVNNTTDSCGALVNYTMPTGFDNCSGPTDPIINGSFEYDYAGWHVSSSNSAGTFGIMTHNQVLPFGGQLWDFGTNTKKTQVTPGLPFTATATDGNKVAVLLETGSATHQMYQDVTLPDGKVVLKFDLGYNNHAGTFDPNNQFFSVVLKNPSTNAVLSTLFKTGSSDPASMPMTTMTYDISAFAGQTIRLTMMQATISNFFFDVMMDNIRIDSMTRLKQTAGRALGQKFPIGTTTNTYVATDLAGNSSTCSFNVTVNDNQAPAVTCPSNKTINCDASNAPGSTGVATAKDNCSVSAVSFADVSTQDPDSNNAAHYNYTITRTWTATDVNSNATNCAQTITVQDVTAPVVNTPANVTVSCDAATTPSATGVATATDNCSPVSVIHTDSSNKSTNQNDSGYYNYIITRTWSATDISGNVSTNTQSITVQDITAPVITCPGNATINCNASAAPSATGSATGTDNCSPVTITYTDNSTQDANANTAGHYNYTITRTWKATDVSGNFSTCVQTIEVEDIAAPVITCPGNATINCNASANPSATGSATGTDNCSPVTITYTDNSTQHANSNNEGYYNYTITRTWKATDVSGNFSTCVQTIEVEDVTAPVITCPGNATINCNASANPSATGTATATDNCSPVTITYVDASTQNANASNEGYYNYTISRTWKATDVSGNFSTCVQTIEVEDVTAPVITCPGNATINCNASAAPSATGSATGTDNCSPVTITYVDASSQNANANVEGHYNYTITRTWKATDVSGNLSTCVQTIMVEDVTAPVVTCPGNATINCNASSAPSATGTATGTDNCSPVTITYVDASTQDANANSTGHYNYTITRTWKATDVSGNFSTCVQTITVEDVTAPVITCPGNATINCNASAAPSATGSATGTDNCSPVTITYIDTSTQDANANNAGHYNYTITRTWKATDVSGNLSTCVQTIMVEDVTAPVVTCPGNATINCNASSAPSATGTATGTDNCSPVTITYVDASTQDANANSTGHYNYTITRTWKATDVSGNFSTCVQTITVEDVTAPVITCPGNATINCNASTIPSATGTATGTDNCSPVTITYVDASSQNANANVEGHYNYTITRTWKATDVSGNFSACVQTITVKDVTAPVITCPGNATINCNASANPSAIGTATGTDNCSPVTITYIDTSTQDANANNAGHYNYTITRTWKATDVSGNFSTCVQIITVEDVAAPTITCPGNATINCNASANPSATGTATGIDNCSSVIITYVDASTQDANANNAGHYNYTITRTWKGTDVSGNFSICVQTITVEDITAPVITCPGSATINCNASANPSATGSATGTDNCSPVTITYTDVSTQDANANVEGYYNYTISRTWKATDVSGNFSTCVQTIEVEDVTAPVITCPGNATINCNASSAPSATGTATATDNCSPVSITYTDASTQDANANNTGHYNYTITRTWKATDVSGNFSTCVQTITVEDITAPVITCPGSATINCNASANPSATGSATGTDNCSSVTITYTDNSTQHANSNNEGYYNYTITRTWKATDVSGNFSTCVQTIEVEDVTAPVITCPGNATINCNASANPSATGTATGTDNCSPVVITYTDNSTQHANSNNEGYYNYTITRTWKAMDVSGNFSTCVQTIAVEDVTAPVITCPGNTTINCNASANPSATGSATGTDNCSPVTITYTDASTQDANANNDGHYNYTITRTWKATDVSGNFSTCVQTITVEDVTAPVITCPGNATINCNASANPSATGSATGTDNCSPVTITYTDNSTQHANSNNEGYYNYTITRTWKAMDASGNFSTCTQTITVQDIAVPFFTSCPANVTVNCNASKAPSATGTATATDNCGPVTMTYTDSATQNANTASAGHYNYTITRTWKATDVSGNFSTCTQTITVQDVYVPFFTSCPADVSVGCNGSTLPSANGTATAIDNCSPVTITYTDSSTQHPSANQQGHYNYTITRTWKAMDVSGNFNTCTQIITVHDSVAPVITCPGNVTVSCKTTPNDNGAATAMDCSPVTITHSDVSTQSSNPLSAAHFAYTITRTWTATDVSGNFSTCTQVISVSELCNPAIAINPVNTINSNHQDHTIYLGYGPQSVTLSATAQNGVGTRSYNWSPTTGVANLNAASTGVSPQATTTYTVTISDTSGCSIQQSFTVNVIDVRADNNKIKLCHYPIGNITNPQQLSIAAAAVPAHLAHGCILGTCPQPKKAEDTIVHEEVEEQEIPKLAYNEVKVYPNPNNGSFLVELPAGYETANVVITDMTGKMIQRKPALRGSLLQFDLGGVARGTYMVHVITGDRTYRSRIFVE